MDAPHALAAALPGRGWRAAETLPLNLTAFFKSKFFRFLVVGGLNTLFGWGIFSGLILLDVPYPLAGLISTLLGVLFNFKSYGTLVFGSHDNWLIFRFVAVYIACYCVALIPLAWAKAHGFSLIWTAALMQLPMAVISFFLNRTLVYGVRR